MIRVSWNRSPLGLWNYATTISRSRWTWKKRSRTCTLATSRNTSKPWRNSRSKRLTNSCSQSRCASNRCHGRNLTVGSARWEVWATWLGRANYTTPVTTYRRRTVKSYTYRSQYTTLFLSRPPSRSSATYERYRRSEQVSQRSRLRIWCNSNLII